MQKSNSFEKGCLHDKHPSIRNQRSKKSVVRLPWTLQQEFEVTLLLGREKPTLYTSCCFRNTQMGELQCVAPPESAPEIPDMPPQQIPQLFSGKYPRRVRNPWHKSSKIQKTIYIYTYISFVWSWTSNVKQEKPFLLCKVANFFETSKKCGETFCSFPNSLVDWCGERLRNLTNEFFA